MKSNLTSFPIHILLLLIWLVIGASLRFADLGSLPPWTDECATTVFSLGNSFRNVPLNQLIDSVTLLAPFQPIATATVTDVVANLHRESTHPPVYFVLTHLWLKFFSVEGGLVSMDAMRSLSAMFGVMAIPAMFYLGCYTFTSPWVGHMAAGIMAVSPLGIYLAIQARHYTLAILLVIAALGCLVKGVKTIYHHKPLPLKLVLVWVTVNCVGVATHFFFSLGILAQILVFLWLTVKKWQQAKNIYPKLFWWRILAVISGSMVGCLVWLPSLAAIHGRSPTEWIYSSSAIARWLEPLARFPLWVFSMFFMLPTSINDLPLPLVIIFGLISLLLLGGIVSLLFSQLKSHFSNLAVQTLGGYIVAVIAIFMGLTWFLGMDLTLAPRFHFVYFPAIILLVGFALEKLLFTPLSLIVRAEKEGEKAKLFFLPKLSFLICPQQTLSLILCLTMIGGIVASHNFGYLQHERPDLVVKAVAEMDNLPTIIATTHKHHGQTGRMMGIAWGLRNIWGEKQDLPKFFLVTKDTAKDSYEPGIKTLQSELEKLPSPFNLWLVNFRGKVDLDEQKCFAYPEYPKSLGQYKYKLYRCGS